MMFLREERDRQWARQHLNDAKRSGVDSRKLEYPGHDDVSSRRRGGYISKGDE